MAIRKEVGKNSLFQIISDSQEAQARPQAGRDTLLTQLSQVVEQGRVQPATVVEMQQAAVEMIIQAREEGLLGHLSTSSFWLRPGGRLELVAPAGDPVSEAQVVQDYGDVLINVLIGARQRPKRLVQLATACMQGEITTLADLHLQLERRMERPIYWRIIAVIGVCLALLWWLSRGNAAG